jgi:iron(III) transport system ATP-binding protein
VFGDNTAAITDADAWLRSLDRLGIVSDRVALLDTFTVRQNIALPLTLDLDQLPPDSAAVVRELARAAGLAPQDLDIAAGEASPVVRLRARLARALALSPRLLVMEHPSASLPRSAVPRVARDVRKLIRERRCSALIVSVDRDFTAAADRQLVLDPVTGTLRPRGIRAWFR